MSKQGVSVLIVDDSEFMRKALKRMLDSEPTIKVVGYAKDGFEAVERVRQLKPDVVTLDVRMPGMDGLQALEVIMRENPTRVLMVSSMTTEGGEITLRALGMGAVDFIDKSACHSVMDIMDIANSLVQKIKIIAGVDLRKVAASKPAPATEALSAPKPEPPTRRNKPSHIVAIGASTGGPMSLEKVLVPLPDDYPGAILVVQHMPPGFTRFLAERMNRQCRMRVKEAEDGDLILAGTIYIGASGNHLKIRRLKDGYSIFLSRAPSDTPHCPSVDVMMKSVAETWGGRMLGIVLTGMGQDGMEGVQAMKRQGATILAQNEETCVVFGMPRAAQLTGCVDRMVPLDKVIEEICRFKA